MENRKKKVSVTESSSVHKVHAKDVDEINEPHYRSYKDDLKAEKRSYRGIQEIIILNNQLIRLCSHSLFTNYVAFVYLLFYLFYMSFTPPHLANLLFPYQLAFLKQLRMNPLWFLAA